MSPAVGSSNQEEAVMATLIGVVSNAVGEVFAVAGDGSRRPLTEGDKVFSGEKLVTGSGGAVALSLTNGQNLTLGRDSSLDLNANMLANTSQAAAEAQADAQPAAEAAPAASAEDIEDADDLLAAIEAGVDPTLEGEAGWRPRRRSLLRAAGCNRRRSKPRGGLSNRADHQRTGVSCT